jgi:chromosome partitioning protein
VARNLLVAAGQAGIRAVGVDLDQQQTFFKWAGRRAKSREKVGQIVAADVLPGEADQWSLLRQQVSGYDLAVVDTPPGVEHTLTHIARLCREADFVLIPTSPSTDDLESVVPWWRPLAEHGCKGAFLLNKANRRTKSYGAARSALLRHGALAPIEIPQLEDIAAPFSSGLAVVDYDKVRGAEVMTDVWRYVRREVGL